MEIIGMKKMKSGPGGVPGEEQKSHLRRSDAVDKLLASAMIRQPTLIVAWVGIRWHASAHKGCPVFPRRAPGLNAIAVADDR